MPSIGSMPSVAIPRSRFRQEFDHVTSWKHGHIIPLDCFEVIAGDDYSVHKAGIEVHMSQPIAPIMGNIKMKIVAFFVPMRLLWEHTEEFFGANKTSAGVNNNTYTIPKESLFRSGVLTDSVSHYLGKPYCQADTPKYTAGYGRASVLKERGYYLIWSEWFRHQQLQNPFILDKGDTGAIGSLSGVNITTDHAPMKCIKQSDYFTSCLLSPQYGAAVSLPLGSIAPVMFSFKDTHATSDYHLLGFTSQSGKQYGYNLNASGGPVNTFSNETTTEDGDTYLDINSTGGNLYVDLASATAAKINDIRYAFQLQKYLERNNYGTRFFEMLAVHYGVTSPDSRLQRPEYLGGKSAPIVIRTVLSTAGYDASTNQNVGSPGASSITYIDLSGLFSKGFVEPGYVYVLGFNNHERLYSQGIAREDSKFDRFEFYSPEFANLGDQAVKSKEIYMAGEAADENVFGYIGHWDEYRYRKKIVSGLMDPAVPSALSFWTLAETFASRPSLSSNFIEENRDCISRCLVTGSTGPDYLGDIFIEYAATRELPLYNIPGLIDHFGAL